MWEWNLHRWHRSCCANPHTTFCMNHVNSLFYAMFYHHRVIHMLNPENLWFYKHYLNGSMWPQTVRWAAIDVYLAKPLRGFKQDLITPATTPDPLLHLCCSYTITSHKESISPCSQCRGEGPTDALGIKEFKKKKNSNRDMWMSQCRLFSLLSDADLFNKTVIRPLANSFKIWFLLLQTPGVW